MEEIIILEEEEQMVLDSEVEEAYRSFPVAASSFEEKKAVYCSLVRELLARGRQPITDQEILRTDSLAGELDLLEEAYNKLRQILVENTMVLREECKGVQKELLLFGEEETALAMEGIETHLANGEAPVALEQAYRVRQFLRNRLDSAKENWLEGHRQRVENYGGVE